GLPRRRPRPLAVLVRPLAVAVPPLAPRRVRAVAPVRLAWPGAAPARGPRAPRRPPRLRPRPPLAVRHASPSTPPFAGVPRRTAAPARAPGPAPPAAAVEPPCTGVRARAVPVAGPVVAPPGGRAPRAKAPRVRRPTGR